MANFEVNHLAINGFAPIDKTIVYGTVAISTTPDILWLDRNIGASQRPVSMNDVSDESRGWFWQFNRKQGYVFINNIRTPDKSLPNLIEEDLNWLTENDPCQELGEGWRLPTKAEWSALRMSIPTGRNQGKYYYNSPMKLHAPGWFYTFSLNKLYSVGLNGKYWANNKGPYISTANYLQFMSSNVSVGWIDKKYGLSIRAVKDI